VVWVDNGELAEHADETWSALAAYSDEQVEPKILVKDGVLVRATQRDLEPYDRYSLREESSRAAQFARMTSAGATNPIYPPLEIMDSLLRRDPILYEGAPRVSAVVDVPIVTPDEELIFEPGIDNDSGIYYRPAPGLAELDWFAAESVDDVTDARDLILTELLGDFDFETPASKANALGLVLLPFVRHLIGDRPTPLHVAMAQQAGSGKTFLIQACLIPGCGLVGMAPEPRDDEELRKLITASLLSARPAVVFDNVNETLASGTLASALTSRVWQDRILGQSKEVSLPIRCIWATTGNSWNASHELVDRVCPISLLPPEGRDVARRRGPSAFRHPDLHGWALEHRVELVQACLTLVKHWLDGPARLDLHGSFIRQHRDEEGWRRQGSEATLGSFERWADVIGGILAACDVPGFLENLDDARLSMDIEEQETREFLHEVRSTFPLGFTSSALAQACLFGTLNDVLPSAISERDLKRHLRSWLRRNNQQRHGDVILHGHGSAGVSMTWEVRGAG
jgi:putative DNA primase/helicase